MKVFSFVKMFLAVSIIATAVSAQQRLNFLSENWLNNWAELSGAGAELFDFKVHMTEATWKVALPKSDVENQVYPYADVIVGGFGEGRVTGDTKIHVTYSSNENLYLCLGDGDTTGASYFAFLPKGKNISRTLSVGSQSKVAWRPKYDQKSVDFRQDWWIGEQPEKAYDLDYSKIGGFSFSIWSDDNRVKNANISIKKFEVEGLLPY